MDDAARLAAELDLLRGRYPDLEYRADGGHWVRIPHYPVPAGWSHAAAEAVFQIPPEVGVAPYGFYVRPALVLESGAAPTNYTPQATTPWGADFALFSWAPEAEWRPTADLNLGPNMLRWADSFAQRLSETS